MAHLGTLFIIAAPSGAGKTSLVASLIESIDTIKVSVSHTTRPRRSEEKDGENYYFVSDAEFTSMVENKQFLEHADVFQHRYGTSREWVEQQLKVGTDVILEIDWQGARQIRQHEPDCVGIFILPPSRKSLLQRLQSRGQDDPEVIAARMAKAKDEMAHYHEFEYLVVNDDFDHAMADLMAIIRSRHNLLEKQLNRHQDLLQKLLD